MKLPTLNTLVKVAKMAVKEGGKVLLKHWGKLAHIEFKDVPGNLVTEADRESEQVILQCIRAHFPGHKILSEEAGLQGSEDAESLWIVDPLDGTTNYTHQYPMVAVTIAFQHQGQLLLGVTYDPFRKELFLAKKGKGVWLNEKPIHVSQVKELQNSLLATGFAYDRRTNPETNYAEFCHLTHCTHGVRRGGSAALDLAYVAAGRLDGFWERGLKPWDMAAGVLLVEEAGGKVTTYDQKPFYLETANILATNGHLHDCLFNELKGI